MTMIGPFPNISRVVTNTSAPREQSPRIVMYLIKEELDQIHQLTRDGIKNEFMDDYIRLKTEFLYGILAELNPSEGSDVLKTQLTQEDLDCVDNKITQYHQKKEEIQNNIFTSQENKETKLIELKENIGRELLPIKEKSNWYQTQKKHQKGMKSGVVCPNGFHHTNIQ